MTAAAISETPPEIAAVEKKASGSSFYMAMKLMPKDQREAMFAIYAFCRAVDDIADDGIGDAASRTRELHAWRSDIDALYGGSSPQRLKFIEGTIKRFGLKREDMLAVIDGMQMDVDEEMQGEADLAKVDLYCDRVASAVGRLSVKVFGMEEAPGVALAHHLGRALQLTNILRDLDEDASLGRLYLPSEYLASAGITSHNPREVMADPRIDTACRAVAKLAHQHYAEADKIMRARPKGHLRAPRLMGSVYSRILTKMEVVGWAPPRERVKLGKGTLLMVLLRDGLAA
ncbi:MAG: presqualene diphosphate synthase HpnD [Alphaproteobacteria bacterium]